MSNPYKGETLRAAAVLLSAAVLACGGTEPIGPPSAVVPVEIISVPDLDTLALNDSLLLTVRSDSGPVASVEWFVVERNEVTGQDTLVYRPPAAGIEHLRAVAELADGRTGAALRAVVTRRNHAPVVVIRVTPELRYERVPLGSVIELVASYHDPDGDAIPPESVIWSQVDEPDPLHVGDTLRLSVDGVLDYRIRLEVTDAAGATATVRFHTTGYDPIVPADWRSFLGRPAGVITETGSGVLVFNFGQKHDGGNAICECPVFGLQSDGTRLWQVAAGSGAPSIAAGDAEVYFTDADGTLKEISDAGDVGWTLPGAVTGAVMFADGTLGVLSRDASGSSRTLRRLTAQGQQLWNVPLGVARVHGAAVAQDSTVYVMASPTTGGRVLAVSSAGNIVWQRDLPAICCVLAPFIPVNDSTVLAFADSVYALRPDGSVRWTRERDGGRTVVDAAGNAHRIGNDDLVVYRSDDGSEVRRTPIDSGSAFVSPILTADGAIIIGSRSLVLALDAATHAERWRHQMAGRVRDILLTGDGLLVMADGLGHAEGLTLSAGPLASPWPQGYASARRTSRAAIP